MGNRKEAGRVLRFGIFVLAIAPVALLGGRCSADATDSVWDYPLLADVAANPTTAPSAPPASANNSNYTLFNPTPESLLRPFTVDRPQVTDRPYSVDAGHLQIESDVFNYEYSYSAFHDSLGGVTERIEQTNLFSTGFRLGLINNADLEVDVRPYADYHENSELTQIMGAGILRTYGKRYVQGIEDIVIRSTINLLGNDGGPIAVGIIPYLVTPTGDRFFSFQRVEGGFEVPAELALPRGFDVIAEAGFGIDRNLANTIYGGDFYPSVALEHNLFLPGLKGFVEYHADMPIQLQRIFTSGADIGLNYLINRNFELYAAGFVPVTDRYTGYTYTLGLALRL
jgi:hypothetical protein